MIRAGTVRASARATWSGTSLVLLLCLPLAIAGSVRTPVDSVWLPVAAGFAMLALAALLRPIEPAPGEKFSLAGAVTFFGALVVPGAYAVAALTAAAITAKLIQRASLPNTLVNSAKVAGAVGAALVVTDRMGPTSLPQIVLAAGAYLAVTLGTVAVMVAATQGAAAVLPFLRREWLQNAGLISVGGAAGLLWARDPLALVLLVPPLALIEIAARATSRERAATEALRRAHEAQRAFAGDAAHELRTPLTTLMGDLAFVRPSALPANEAAALEGARREVDRMSLLVERLLALARSEGAALAPGTCDVAQTIGRATRGLSFRAGVAFSTAVPADVRVALPTELLASVLHDVISNAASYTERGMVAVRARRAGPMVEIEVRDTGIGLSPEERARVFDRFYRGPRARSLAPGTGLGLAIAREIVTRSGGSIGIESAIGRGTLVTVTLPAAGSPSPT